MSPHRLTSWPLVLLAFSLGHTGAPAQAASWLDEPKPKSWNAPDLAIPAATNIPGNADPRCRQTARPPELSEDKALRDRGWDLVGGYQGGWRVLVIQGTSGYDGMCRPLQYQGFVFVHGRFAGTLSPRPMDSRSDGALERVFIQSASRLTAQYARYEASDPLCCPSRTTYIDFEIANDPPIVRPLSAVTSRVVATPTSPRASGVNRNSSPPAQPVTVIGD